MKNRAAAGSADPADETDPDLLKHNEISLTPERGLTIMKISYPYCLFYPECGQSSPLASVSGTPYMLSLSDDSFHTAPPMDMLPDFQEWLDRQMGTDYSWGISTYLENREPVLRSIPDKVREQRFFHLGVDIILPRGSSLYTPLAATVAEIGFEEGRGSYGNYAVLKHSLAGAEPFYTMYGHLQKSSVPEAGTELDNGEKFAVIGDFSENGHWFYHTHVQIITEKGREKGYIHKGYCSAAELADIETFTPSPVPLLCLSLL